MLCSSPGLEVVKDRGSRFPLAIALSHLGEHQHLNEFAPILRGDSSWEVAPLIPALTVAKNPIGLRTIYERLILNEISDFTIKELATTYAVEIKDPWSDLILLYVTEDADLELRIAAVKALKERYGEDESTQMIDALQRRT